MSIIRTRMNNKTRLINKSNMKKAFAISAITVLMVACSSPKDGSTTSTFTFDTTKVDSGKTFYQCPMHLEVISEKADNCPKCDMALESVVKQ